MGERTGVESSALGVQGLGEHGRGFEQEESRHEGR